MKELIFEVLAAFEEIRTYFIGQEMDLHLIVANKFDEKKIPYIHEAPIGCRSRIDFIVHNKIGVEIKRGRPNKKQLLKQLEKYMSTEDISALIVLSGKMIELPSKLQGKPLYSFCINASWGVALP